MAGASLFTLLDDIASVLDDVAAMSKVAAKKTAGVLGDDLALNAQQISGVNADRELPVVWAVAKGSFKNKAILVPAALAISVFIPWLITPLLMIGGAFLCYEGVEKLVHSYRHRAHKHAAQQDAAPPPDLKTLERTKVQGAIRTDFILSAEIIVIALGTVAGAPISQQIAVLVGIAIAMTVGVYGLVAAIVKMDDAGLYLSQQSGAVARLVGRMLLAGAPRLMKLLSIVGTAAMFMVGGGIIAHALPPVHHLIEAWAASAGTLSVVGPLLGALTPTLLNMVLGAVVGAVVLGAVALVQRVRGASAAA